jgi:hypothetical protein
MKNKLADKVSNLYNTMLFCGGIYDVDDERVDDEMEEIVKKIGHTSKQKNKKGFYKFAFGEHPKFETLTNKQLQAIIPFLEAIIEDNFFDSQSIWDGNKLIHLSFEEN